MQKLKYILFILLFASANLYSQGKVVVRVKRPPPYHFFTENMFNLEITNLESRSYNIYLHGRATEHTKGLIADATTGTFLLPVGVKQVRSNDVGKVTINESNKTYEDVISRMSALPTGSYDICVDVVDASTNQVLGSECIEHEVLNISQIQLVYPDNQSDIAFDKFTWGDYGGDDYKTGKTFLDRDEDSRTSNKKIPVDTEVKDSSNNNLSIVRGHIRSGGREVSRLTFTWLPPVPVPRGYSVRYKIKIAEVIGMQSAYDAMQSNPLFYNQSNIVTTSYLYPIAARNFSAGRKYAWQVEAYVNGVLLTESEINEFSYEDNNHPMLIRKGGKSRPWLHEGMSWLIPEIESIRELHLGEGTASSLTLNKTKPFLFSFSSMLYGESANRSGTGSDKEPRNGYLELTPSLGIYNIPFSTSILLSSENSLSRQNINTAGMNLDVSTIKDLIMERVNKEKDKLIEEGKKELSNLTEKQKEKLEGDAKSKVMSRMNPVLKFMSYFPSIGIGTTYPSYTPLTVNGVALTGLNFEFNPGWFYMAFGGFKNQKPIDNVSFKRFFYSGRIGYGQKDKSHVYLTGLYAKDDANSIKVDTSNQLLTPNSNYLFGIEGRLNLLKEKLTIEAEAVGSMLTRDNRDADLENKSIPNFVKNLFHPKISSQIDYSYTFRTIFNNEKSNTKLKGEVKMIGPGFITLGNPSLKGDNLQVEGKVEQKFMNKQVSVSASVKWLRDNLIKSRSSTTSKLLPGLTINLNIKKYPYVVLSYNPYFMKNDATDADSKVDYKSHLFMLNSGNYLKLGSMYLNSSLSYMLNTASSLDTSSGYTTNSLTLSEALSFEIPLSLSGSFSMTHTKYVSDYSRILSFDGNVSYVFDEFWTNTVGASSTVEKDKNKKIYFYLETVLNLVKNVSINIRAEKNLYHDWRDNTQNYDEFLLKGTVTTSW